MATGSAGLIISTDELAALQGKLADLNDFMSKTQADLAEATMAAENAPGAIDHGDTAWVLTSTCIVLMMSIPGLALFYGGLSQKKNVLSTIMQTYSIACLITVEWLMMGYSLCFSTGSAVYGDASRFWLLGTDTAARLGPNTSHALAPNLPESVFMMFQLVFAIITGGLVCGGFAERMKFYSVLVFIFFWHFLVYCPVAHSEWAVDGFLAIAGDLDFAGGNVVHICSGVSALAASIILGPRKHVKNGEEVKHHCTIYIAMGGAFLWIGWFGFNGGSALSAGGSAGFAVMVSQISAATGGLTWIALDILFSPEGHPSLIGMVSGTITGLIIITPACGYVDHTAAFVMALIGTPVVFFGVRLKKMLKFDDALDAFGVHGIGGMMGGLLTGFFANEFVSGNPTKVGCFYGNCRQIGLQIYGMVVVAGWSFVMSSVILLALKYTIGIRVSDEDEDTGLDISEHGDSMP